MPLIIQHIPKTPSYLFELHLSLFPTTNVLLVIFTKSRHSTKSYCYAYFYGTINTFHNSTITAVLRHGSETESDCETEGIVCGSNLHLLCHLLRRGTPTHPSTCKTPAEERARGKPLALALALELASGGACILTNNTDNKIPICIDKLFIYVFICIILINI